MEDKGGYPVKACQNIVNLILNKEWLVNSNDNDTFASR
jgi:hypothetical protein